MLLHKENVQRLKKSAEATVAEGKTSPEHKESVKGSEMRKGSEGKKSPERKRSAEASVSQEKKCAQRKKSANRSVVEKRTQKEAWNIEDRRTSRQKAMDNNLSQKEKEKETKKRETIAEELLKATRKKFETWNDQTLVQMHKTATMLLR